MRLFGLRQYVLSNTQHYFYFCLVGWGVSSKLWSLWSLYFFFVAMYCFKCKKHGRVPQDVLTFAGCGGNKEMLRIVQVN